MLAVMRMIAALLFVCAACGSDDVELYPVNPGGGGPSSGTGGGIDAGEDLGDGGVTVSGRVCLTMDARIPNTCPDTGVGGLTVMLGTRSTTTMDDGRFSMRVISGASNVWRVSGTGIVPSATIVLGANIIPALSSQVYSDMVATNSASSAGGAIIARLRDNTDAVVQGATATTTPAPAGNVFYDSQDAITWDQTATGNLGIVWVPGVAAGTAKLSVTKAQSTSEVTDIPVFADTITWVFAQGV